MSRVPMGEVPEASRLLNTYFASLFSVLHPCIRGCKSELGRLMAWPPYCTGSPNHPYIMTLVTRRFGHNIYNPFKGVG